MSNSSAAAKESSGTGKEWNEDKVYFVLGDPVRRRLLLTLARGGPRIAADLMGGVSRTMDCTLKHLSAMEGAGVAVRKPNPADGRRPLYALSPDVVIRKTAESGCIDFGFCQIRL